ncbi:MAG: malonyl-CoA decarboxylase family protein [Rhodocyclaceae bacterium]|nr:malonyl-CoA decarboxylase family protein [Rhodocyclaceae bacterium]
MARFHLGNGARIERINWLADISPKGFRQACGLMVNYVYDPDEIESNVEAFSSERPHCRRRGEFAAWRKHE